MPRFDASFAAAIDSGSAMRVREFVLSNPASVNLKLSTGDWPLSYAIRTGREEAAIALIQNGADLTLLDPSSGDSFLHIAATHGRLMVIEALVQNGASPSQPHNLTGRTPMDYAAGAPDRATVELLRRLQSRSQRRN